MDAPDPTTPAKADRRGTIWDWPIALIAAALVLLVVSGGASLAFSALVIVIALVIFAARRGVFSSRK